MSSYTESAPGALVKQSLRGRVSNSLRHRMFGQIRKVLNFERVQKLTSNLAPSYELVQGPLTYNQDGLASCHNADFMKEPLFMDSYALGKSTGSWGESDIHWRAFVACWAANKAKTLPGDFVECGVNKGGLALTVINYVDLNSLGKKFYLLDTFAGLSEKYISDKERVRGVVPGGYEECYAAVCKTFENFNVEIIRGTVPDTLSQVTTERVSYLSIDMNCALPEVAAAEFFWPKLVSGAVIVLDDYGWPTHEEQKLELDVFAKKHDVQVLPLPTGQGLIIKP
jgi:O-methyltransferase